MFNLSTISLIDFLVPFNLKLPPTKKVLAIFVCVMYMCYMCLVLFAEEKKY